jgi:hypothetical protein
MDAAPSWPRLIAAAAVMRLSERLLAVAERNRRRVALAAVWLSERSAGIGRRLLTAR